MEEDKLNLNLNDDSSFREFHTTSNFKVKNSLSNQWHPLNIQAHRDIYPHGQTRFSNFKTNYWTWLFCLQPKTNSDYWKKSIIVGLDENNLDQEIKNLGLDTKWGKLKRSLLKTDVKILRVQSANRLLLRFMYVHSFLEIGTIGTGGLPSLTLFR